MEDQAASSPESALIPLSSPIDSTLGRITSASADGHGIHVIRRQDAEPGWIGLDQLLTLEPDLIAALMAGVRGMSEAPADHIKAEWMVESYARALGDLAGSFLLSDGRLPDLDAGNLMVATRNGLVLATGVRSERMYCLPNDRKATKAGATIVEDWKGLADLMVAGLTSLLEPMVKWIDGHGLRPEKTLWYSCGDRIAQSLVWSGKAFNKREAALELTEYLMEIAGRMAVPVERDEDEFGEPFHQRSTCCLAYRTPESGYCRSCPLIQ